MSIASDWNIQQKNLKELISKKETFDSAKELYLSMHKYLHFSDIDDTLMNQLWKSLDTKDFSIMPTINKEWKKKLNVEFTDTGNAMTDDEIMELSRNINIDVLKEYRKAVGNQSQNILSKLVFEDMKRRVESKNIEKILKEGGVTTHPDSIWLLDFWDNTYAWNQTSNRSFK